MLHREEKRWERGFSDNFCQACLELTYNGSIVGLFAKPEFSQFLHQVFGNITNHQRFALQRGNGRGEGEINPSRKWNRHKIPVSHTSVHKAYWSWPACSLSKASEHHISQKKHGWKQDLKKEKQNTLTEHLSVLISLFKATQLTRSISLSTPEVGLFSELLEVNFTLQK